MTAARGEETARAVSAFVVDRAHLLLPLAAQLGPAQTDFESAIRGNSMAPAIPGGARLRVRIDGQRSCEVGDVVFYLADDGYTVHRVVRGPRRISGGDYLLAEGDARFAPDPPVPCRQVLGTVVAVQINGEWQPIGPQTPGPWHRRAVRAVTLPAMIITMWVSLGAAARLAALLLSLESRARLARRRLLHRRAW
ncbi:MAG: S24/S26 family peptidase [Candidatus Binatia bacterium]